MVKVDVETEDPSKFQLSYAYRNWDNVSSSSGVQTNGVNKCLQEIIRKTATKCGIDDVSETVHTLCSLF